VHVIKLFLWGLGFVLVAASVPAETTQFPPANPEQTLDRVVAETLAAHSATTVQGLSVTEMTSEQLIRLGRAVMGVMVGDPQWHEWMNAMMGGEGSERLDALHTALGEAYVERGGRIPTWHGSVGAPGMIGGHDQRWFMPHGAPSGSGAFGGVPRRRIVLFAAFALILVTGAVITISRFRRK
jgi:hypothetical protein